MRKKPVDVIKINLPRSLLLIFSVVFCPPALAEGNDISLRGFERAEFRAGLYQISARTRVRVDGNGGNIGTTLNFEDDLNIPRDDSTGFFGARLRVKSRHFFEYEHFGLSRAGAQTLTGEIEFDDTVFPVGADVRSFFDIKVNRLGYTYALAVTPTFGIGLSGGIHVTEIDTGITEVTIDTPFALENTEIAKVTAPLPVIGVTGAWRISENWRVKGRLQLFRLQFDGIAGQLDHVSLTMENTTFKNVGFGLGWDLFALDVSMKEQYWNGKVDFRFSGPMIFLMGYF